jgi:hypothetical protein
MAVTREDALIATEFHFGTCKRVIGPRGGEELVQEKWRRNGETRTWKTRPNDFAIPLKFGIVCRKSNFYTLTNENDTGWHTAQGCQPVVVDKRKDQHASTRRSNSEAPQRLAHAL